MQYVFTFEDAPDGDKTLLGGKGAGLAKMHKMGLPIPEGRIISTEACNHVRMLADKVGRIDFIEALAHSVIDLTNGSLVSVRSGARVSMPGMMDTVLNVGITSGNMPEWFARIGEWAALDSYRRLMQMMGETVFGLPSHAFSHALETTKKFKYGMAESPVTDSDMSVTHLRKLIDKYRVIYTAAGIEFPDTIFHQLVCSIAAVFQSWSSERAKAYREINHIPEEWGTACVVQKMVFGNLNARSGSGVLFTRCPSTGVPTVTGEFLPMAQGEDVVAGVRTPLPLSAMTGDFAQVHQQLILLALSMEATQGDMQDMEFTVEDGKLYILQTRTGKRAARAAFRIAHDMVIEGRISKEDALQRVTAQQYLELLKPSVSPLFNIAPTGTGIAASAGLVTGYAVFDNAQAQDSLNPCILLRNETNPDDFPGMAAALGILTATGGTTSHAAVVARGMNKPCVTGLTELTVSDKYAYLNGMSILSTDKVTIDGATGRVWINVEVPVIGGELEQEAITLLSWGGVAATPLPRIQQVCDIAAHTGTVVIELSHPDMSTLTLLASALSANPSLNGSIVLHPYRPDDFTMQKMLGRFMLELSYENSATDLAVAFTAAFATVTGNWVVHGLTEEQERHLPTGILGGITAGIPMPLPAVRAVFEVLQK